MLIKFSCDNHCADFTKDEIEVIEQGQSFTNCAFCGEKLHITNINDILEADLETRIKNNINRWISQLGLEGCIELVERNKDQSCSRLYFEELRKRGIIK